MAKKNYRRSSAKPRKKRYTVEERIAYHRDRAKRSSAYGLKLWGTKHQYSIGFHEGAIGRDNSRPTEIEFGKKAARAYKTGHERGRKAARIYIKKTGKQIF